MSVADNLEADAARFAASRRKVGADLILTARGERQFACQAAARSKSLS